MLQPVAENGLEEEEETSPKEQNNNRVSQERNGGSEGESEEEEYLESWVRIQQSTFINWLNDKLRPFDITVTNLRRDLKDGVALCRLMQVLQKRKLGRVRESRKRMSQIEASGNIAMALQAMKEDGLKLINIGASDVAGGNTKLLLGLMWSLIRHYQIGSQSRLPPRKLILHWLNAVLYPHRTVSNFTSDWNDGIALHGVIEYCHPGTCPDWYRLNASDRVGNCEAALRLAQQVLDIPPVLSARDLASRDLDELAAMTYLSYYMAEGAPGYRATLSWVRGHTSDTPVTNFDKDWNNGYVLSCLVNSLGGVIPGWPATNSSDWIGTLKLAMDVSSSQLGVEPILSTQDMVQENVDHIGVMAYAAWHRAKTEKHDRAEETPPREVNPPPPAPAHIPPPPVVIPGPPPPQQKEEVPPVPVDVVVMRPPTQPAPTPTPSIVRHARSWRLHAVHNIAVYTESLGAVYVKVMATAPDGRDLELTSTRVDLHVNYISFLPTVTGLWRIALAALDCMSGEELAVAGSPFEINVYSAAHARIMRDEEKTTIPLNQPFKCTVDCSGTGLSTLDSYVLFDGEVVEHSLRPTSSSKPSPLQLAFTPTMRGPYTVALYCGGIQIPGSPFTLLCKNIDVVRSKGPGLLSGAIGHETNFMVDYSEGEVGHVSVVLTDPNGQRLDTIVRLTDTGVAEVTYTPLIPGLHQLEVFFDGVHVKGSPYTVNVSNKNVFLRELKEVSYVGEMDSFVGLHQLEVFFDGVHVKGSPYTVNVSNKNVFLRELKEVSYVGEMDSFVLDASEAGKGQLEIDSDLPIRDYKPLAERVFRVSYVARRTGKHDLTIKYNSIVVHGCPCSIDVQERPTEPEKNTENGDVTTTGGDET